VLDYNAAERRYTVVLLTSYGPAAGRSLIVREKAIKEVVKVITTSPKFEDWQPSDARSYFAYEFSLLGNCFSTEYGGSNNIDIGYHTWSMYKSAYNSMMKHKESKVHLREFLKARTATFAARNLPLRKVKKSRTVMRRLRKKGRVRNSNSSVSKHKQRVAYWTPNDVIRRRTQFEAGISTRRKGKTRLKDKKRAQATAKPKTTGDSLQEALDALLAMPEVAGSIEISADGSASLKGITLLPAFDPQSPQYHKKKKTT
jgi:hypothetical protein